MIDTKSTAQGLKANCFSLRHLRITYARMYPLALKIIHTQNGSILPLLREINDDVSSEIYQASLHSNCIVYVTCPWVSNGSL